MTILFVNKAATQTGTSATPSYTIDPTGANILWVGITIRDTRSITVAPAFNGVTMTLSGSTSSTTGVTNRLYYLVSPNQGSANVTFTQSASDSYAIAGIWFSGASLTGVPDATSASGPTTTTSFSTSVTSVADNCFAVSWGDASGGSALTGGSNTTVANQPEVAFTGAYLIYSTALKTPAGSFTLNVTSSSQSFAACMASFKPGPVIYTLTAAAGSYTLTGIAATLKAVYRLVAATGNYILTGVDATLRFIGWSRQNKSSASSYTNNTKNNSTWVDDTKH